MNLLKLFIFQHHWDWEQVAVSMCYGSVNSQVVNWAEGSTMPLG